MIRENLRDYGDSMSFKRDNLLILDGFISLETILSSSSPLPSFDPCLDPRTF